MHKIKNKHALIDALKNHMCCETDTQLGEVLELERTHLSRMRLGICIISDAFMVIVHENTGWPFSKIRELRYKSNLNVPQPTDSVQKQISEYEEHLRRQFNKGVQNGKETDASEATNETAC